MVISKRMFFFSHAQYVMSADFTDLIVSNTDFVQAEFGFNKNRTSRSYGMLISFVNMLQRMFPEQFTLHGLTQESFKK